VKETSVAKDPVCAMSADEKSTKFKSTFQGETYYFCALGCKEESDKNPKKFIK